MQLNRLQIRRNYNDKLEGEIEVAGETGRVIFSVDEILCQRIVEVCAAELVQVAKGIARDMTAELITAVKRPEISR